MVHNKSREKKWANRLRKVDLVTVRENTSLEYLRSIGVVENVRRVADPAFQLPAHAEGSISLASLQTNRIVGIGMSALVSRYGSSEDKYVAAFTAFGKALLSDTNTHLVLVPHVILKEKSGNDELVCQQIAARLPDNDRVTLLNHKYNACQMKHVISQCDYFIGARMHSTIASLSSCIPTISIGYSTKSYGINKDIFGHTDYVLPISDLDERSLMAKFILLCNKRYEIVKQLRRQLPLIESMAIRGGQFLVEMLERSSHLHSLK